MPPFNESPDAPVIDNPQRSRFELALPPGQARAALAKEGVIALGELAQEFIGRRCARRRFDLCGTGLGSSVADVLAGAGGKQHGLLRHQANLSAQHLRIEAGNIHPLNANASSLRIIEP